ncbi:MAG: type I methionyl aminopeptidase [Opitutales bacterium]|jgi:methionyl aminopeptidase
MIQIKNSEQIEGMRKACRVAADVLDRLAQMVAPGTSTFELDQATMRLIEEYGARSACYDYRVGRLRYPSYACLSVNEEIVHGIGRTSKILRMGDIITLDVCVVYDGWVGDNARTVTVGPVSADVERLLDVTREALFKGIDMARRGNRVGDISSTIQRHVENNGMGIVREFVGHGVGRGMHEEPQVPNYGQRGRGPRLAPGMTICIEPMVTLGSPDLTIGPDGWVAIARDGKPAAHFEHTVLITNEDPEILTLPSSQRGK